MQQPIKTPSHNEKQKQNTWMNLENKKTKLKTDSWTTKDTEQRDRDKRKGGYMLKGNFLNPLNSRKSHKTRAKRTTEDKKKEETEISKVCDKKAKFLCRTHLIKPIITGHRS